MANKLTKLVFLAVVGTLLLAACGSESEDVPSLEGADETQAVEPTGEPALDDEAKMMAFTQCVRDQGLELLDPVVDAEGNVQQPALSEGVEMTREESNEPYAACAHHLKGLTIGREREDPSELVDQFVALASCLREKGYDVDDPTAEMSDQWRADFRVEFDWDDPAALADYEECSGDTLGEGQGK